MPATYTDWDAWFAAVERLSGGPITDQAHVDELYLAYFNDQSPADAVTLLRAQSHAGMEPIGQALARAIEQMVRHA